MEQAVLESHRSAAPVEAAGGVLQLEFAQHNICFVLPAGAVLNGNLDLPGGALIYGTVKGNVSCREGTLVLAQGSEFSGRGRAPMVYLCGTVRSIGPNELSEITGDILLAVSATADGRSRLASRSFAIHSKTFAGFMQPIV